MLKVGIALLLLFALAFQITAQKVHRTVASFGGECSGTTNVFSKDLGALIADKKNGNNYENCLSTNEMCANSFNFDLNGDKRNEYFVRLSCGATGNCTYGVFEDGPARLLGEFTAWFFWVDPAGPAWRKITTYVREGGDQGYIRSYSYSRGKYYATAGRRERFDSSQKSFPEKMGMPDCTGSQ